MLKHAVIAAVVASIVGVVGIARAESVGPSPPSDPQPTAPGTGPYQKGTWGLALPITLISNLGTTVSFGEPIGAINLLRFLNDKAALDLILGLNVHKQQIANGTPPVLEDATVFGILAGLGYRLYTHKEKLHKFIEPQLIFNWADIQNSQTLAIQLGAVLGFEREIVESVSVTGAVGLYGNFAKEFNDIQLATQATLSVNVYWK